MQARAVSRFLVLAALIPLASCAERAGSDGAGAATARSTVVVAYTVATPALNVLHTRDVAAAQLQRDVLFMPLVRFDGLEPTPWLAERWDTARVAPDTLELTFHLRRDVAWHDGAPTTAEDVRFTFERAMDPATAAIAARHFAHYHPRAEVLDSFAVRFRLRAHGGFLHAWQDVPPLPRHLLHDVAPAEIVRHPFGRAPLGNGPFRFVRTHPHDGWEFEANPDFPRALGGPPAVQRLVVRAIGDELARNIELRNGRVHLTYVFPPHVAALRADDALAIHEFATRTWVAIVWNTRLPIFADARVRRALAMAIDRQTLTAAVLDGHGTAGRATVTPLHPHFAGDDATTALAFDPESARHLLHVAGWRDRSGDGTLRDGDGRALHFAISFVASAAHHRHAGEMVQAQLARIGVHATLQPVEYNTLLQRTGSGGADARDFEAVIMSYVDAPRKDDAFLFHSTRLDAPGAASGFSSPALDSLLDRLTLAPLDGRSRDAWLDYQRLIAREAPLLVLYYQNGFAAAARRLAGLDVDARGMLATVRDWRLAPAP